MKPAKFAFARVGSLDEAAQILRRSGGSAKAVAGAQSLGPMLNLRLVQPSVLVDITAIPELTRIEEDADAITVGACVTTADIEDGRVRSEKLPILATVAGNIAYRAVRNRGTIGGSLSHADPAADWVSALAAFGAWLTLRSLAGARTVALRDFVLGALESALQPGELVETIHIPARPVSAHWGYAKSCRKTGEFAHAIGAVLIDPGASTARVVIGAIDMAPIVMTNPSELFGGRISGDYKERFDARAADALLAKAGVSNAAQRHIHVNVLKRAIREAAA